jgi:23S rRNA (adenine2503-C2)-methyltransferase
VEVLTGLSVQELEDRLEALGVERWRAKPILHWVYRRGASSFGEMTDLSLALREELPRHFQVLRSSVAESRPGPDGTVKHLVMLPGGDVVETVMIPEEDRRTVCISTQVGCPMRCVFCASGLSGLKRNLEAPEIVEQVLHALRGLGPEGRISNVVVMGIGEPLLNAANLIRALRTLKASWGMGIGYRRITLSTVGVIGQLPELVRQDVTPNLAVSLHAPDDSIRAEVVPTMKNVRIADLVKAAVEYRQATGKEVTFEYVILEGINDEKRHALELGKKLKGKKVKVNVIPFNRVEELPYRAPSTEKVDRFVAALGSCGVPVTVRKRKGDAVSAACGQLRARFTAKAGAG